MNRLGTTLSQILVGTLPDSGDPDSLRDAVLDAGRPPGDLVLLRGHTGLDELLGRERRGGVIGHLVQLIRRIESLDGDSTGHVLRAAAADLRDGHTVALVRHVDRSAATPLSNLLHEHGIAHVHYVGRWTVAEHGAVPSIAA